MADSDAGGSHCVDPNRVVGARLRSGDRTRAPTENDPFWQASDEPVRGGIAEGGADTTELAVPASRTASRSSASGPTTRARPRRRT
ncbi:hypothetical protein OG411_00720 [Streptomyces pseudogriseolus]|uniref:hypothetical protein n=1 Tax=Streptomyces pseudogriseolus TaxID=36817 RepID=UPI00324C4629